MRNKWISFLLMATMLLSLAACGTPAASTPGTASGSGATNANKIVIGRPFDSDNLDPVTCIGNPSIWVFNLVLEGLVKTSDDGTTIEPCLAETWEISEDGLVYTFKLAKDIKFTDGSKVTAADWQWTFDRAMNTPDSKWKFAADPIEKVEVPDDETVIITLKAPSAATLANLSMFNLSVQSKSYYDKVGAEAYKDGCMGTGPYMIKEWKRGEQITMVKNPNYRIADLPKTDEIVFKVVADDNSRIMQLQAGEIDVATYVPFSTLKQLESDSRVKPMAIPATETRFIALNTSNQYLSNIKVREAINAITDPQLLVDMVLFGYGTPSANFMADSSSFRDKSYTVNVPNAEKAKALMAEAGYPDGFTVNMLIHSGNAFEEQIATILKDQWAQIGVNVDITPFEKTTYTEKLYATDFDTVIDYWTDDIPDPSQFMAFIGDFELCSGFDTNFKDARLTELYQLAAVEQDNAKRTELYYEMQKIIQENAIFVPLCTVPFGVATSANIEGFVQTPLGNYRFENLVKLG